VLRTNLSTRPFYNERAVHLLLALGAVIVLVLTAFNAIRIIALSRQNTDLSSLINRDHDEAQRLTREAQRIRAGINQTELETTANAAALANSLIDQRTFSWTEFFNHIEETLPPDVMLTSVRPSFNDNVTTIQMTVLGRRSEDLDEFMEKLEATGAFDSVLPAQRDTTEEGLDRILLQTVYTGVPSEESSAPIPAKTTPPAGEAPAPQQPAAKPATPAPQPSTPPPQSGRAARGGTGR
jgi:Tfp pilus assembly protein PilN